MTTKSEYGELFVPTLGPSRICIWRGPAGKTEGAGKNHITALNQLAEVGWQVVSVIQEEEGNRYVMSRTLS